MRASRTLEAERLGEGISIGLIRQCGRCGAPGRTRTCSLKIRSQSLCPVELRAHYEEIFFPVYAVTTLTPGVGDLVMLNSVSDHMGNSVTIASPGPAG